MYIKKNSINYMNGVRFAQACPNHSEPKYVMVRTWRKVTEN